MTTTNNTHVTRSPEALRSAAYENYATAQTLQVQLHNEWRRTRRLFDCDDDNAHVQLALEKAAKAAAYLADAKTQYRLAKRVARAAA